MSLCVCVPPVSLSLVALPVSLFHYLLPTPRLPLPRSLSLCISLPFLSQSRAVGGVSFGVDVENDLIDEIYRDADRLRPNQDDQQVSIV